MTQRIHLARTGTFRDANGRHVNVDNALLSELAENYDVTSFKAPLVLGHPKDGAPAYGWMESLEFKDGHLYGKVGEVATDLSDAVKAGRYRNVSISFWPEDHANNPTKGHKTLRHVGILGAEVPAISGLEPLSFAADDAGVQTIDFADTSFGWRTMKMFIRGVREWIIDRDGQDEADKVVPAYYIDTLEEAADRAADDAPAHAFKDPSTPSETMPKETSMSDDPEKKPAATTDFAEREADLAKREAAVAAREKETAEAADTTRKTAAVSFADGLIKDGKLMPAGKDVVVDVHQRLAKSEEPISFSDGTSKPALASFEELFTGAKPIINLSEQSADDQSTAIDGGNARDLTKRANELVKSGEAVSFSDGVRMAEKEAAK